MCVCCVEAMYLYRLFMAEYAMRVAKFGQWAGEVTLSLSSFRDGRSQHLLVNEVQPLPLA